MKHIVETSGSTTFTIADVYKFKAQLRKRWPLNKTIESTIQFNMQRMRDAGRIIFVDNAGTYESIAHRPRPKGLVSIFATWLEVIREALVHLGGRAHRTAIFEMVRDEIGVPIGSNSADIQKSIDDALGRLSSNSGRKVRPQPSIDDHFAHEGDGIYSIIGSHAAVLYSYTWVWPTCPSCASSASNVWEMGAAPFSANVHVARQVTVR